MNISEVSEQILDFSSACDPIFFKFLNTNKLILAFHVCMYAAHVNEVTLYARVRSTEISNLSHVRMLILKHDCTAIYRWTWV